MPADVAAQSIADWVGKLHTAQKPAATKEEEGYPLDVHIWYKIAHQCFADAYLWTIRVGDILLVDAHDGRNQGGLYAASLAESALCRFDKLNYS